MEGVKNIIFDLGGVLLNIDYSRTSAAFKKLGAGDFDSFYSQQGANQLFEELETGNISETDFYKEMQRHCYPNTTVAQIQDAWNAILLDFREESLQFLKTLNDNYNLFLLSNTNSIHLSEFDKIFARQTGGTNFNDLFDKAYYSHLIHRRKPYPPTYGFVLEDAGISEMETLFIDDSIVNIEGAMEAGLKTHWLKPGERIELLPL
jgi:putative hydrolase of the HAD superfamily